MFGPVVFFWVRLYLKPKKIQPSSIFYVQYARKDENVPTLLRLASWRGFGFPGFGEVKKVETIDLLFLFINSTFLTSARFHLFWY
jgi:hypothetical protein